MINYYLVGASLLSPQIASALVPIEGIIFGDVKDVKQYDPLEGILTKSYNLSSTKPDRDKLALYRALFVGGQKLKYKCEKDPRVTYANKWLESSVKRSVASTLQYIGLDLSIKAVAAYAKKVSLSKNEYQILTDNLVENTCSKNITVYSLKKIKNNFLYYWEEEKKSLLPSLESNPYFSKKLIAKHDTAQVVKREFDYSIRNFRSFCSWGGDTENFGMLTPYLRNPFVMDYLHNHLLKRKISFIEKTGELIYKKDSDGVQVACDNLICRKQSEVDFIKLFPRSVGSSKLDGDLEGLYCHHFQNLAYKNKGLSPSIQNWIKEQSEEEGLIESMNFLAIISTIPEVMIVADKYDDIIGFLKNNLKDKWDKWANKKVDDLAGDLLYEESLEVKLAANSNIEQMLKGEFEISFDLTLGEIDKLIEGADKIDSVFHLSLPSSYISYYKKQNVYFSNRGKYDQAQKLYEDFTSRIAVELEKKKSLFKVNLWNKRMSQIITDELIRQIAIYEGNKFKTIDSFDVKIPVRFRYGLFALQYIKKKNHYLKQSGENKVVKKTALTTLK